MHYFVGALAIVVGAAMIIKTEWLIQNFGTSAWAEEHLGYNGGSRLLYKLIGLAIIIIGFMLVTNLFEAFLLGTIGRIFPH